VQHAILLCGLPLMSSNAREGRINFGRGDCCHRHLDPSHLGGVFRCRPRYRPACQVAGAYEREGDCRSHFRSHRTGRGGYMAGPPFRRVPALHLEDNGFRAAALLSRHHAARRLRVFHSRSLLCVSSAWHKYERCPRFRCAVWHHWPADGKDNVAKVHGASIERASTSDQGSCGVRHRLTSRYLQAIVNRNRCAGERAGSGRALDGPRSRYYLLGPRRWRNRRTFLSMSWCLPVVTENGEAGHLPSSSGHEAVISGQLFARKANRLCVATASIARESRIGPAEVAEDDLPHLGNVRCQYPSAPAPRHIFVKIVS
jgi:hypothetical protein